MSFQKQCPKGTSKIMTMVEGGLGTDEIAAALKDMAELKCLETVEGFPESESFPDEIKVIAQALAFRNSGAEFDLDIFVDVLSAAYSEEVNGLERFRQGEAMSKDLLKSLYHDKSYQWIVVEAPNGQGVEVDGAVLGVCCFSTDGISRKNGGVEGSLGVIRLLGVLPRYQGLCIGNRLLKRTEKAMRSQGCIRSMVCVPSPRHSMCDWIQRRGYTKVCTTQYPKNIGHDLILQKSVELAMYTFALSDINCSTSSSGKSDLKKDGGSYEDNNEDETNNIDDEHADAHIVENSDEGQSQNAKKSLSLPPHWRARQPRLVEKNDLDDNIDYSTDNSDNNQTELNQFHDKVMQFVSSNNNFEKANADSHHKFHQFVISENLIEEYHQPELD